MAVKQLYPYTAAIPISKTDAVKDKFIIVSIYNHETWNHGNVQSLKSKSHNLSASSFR